MCELLLLFIQVVLLVECFNYLHVQCVYTCWKSERVLSFTCIFVMLLWLKNKKNSSFCNMHVHACQGNRIYFKRLMLMSEKIVSIYLWCVCWGILISEINTCTSTRVHVCLYDVKICIQIYWWNQKQIWKKSMHIVSWLIYNVRNIYKFFVFVLDIIFSLFRDLIVNSYSINPAPRREGWTLL